MHDKYPMNTPIASTIKIPPIASLVPHSGSMLLLDRVVASDAERLQAEVAITPHTLFADENGVGSWIGIEYMAQAVAAYAGLHAYRTGQHNAVEASADSPVAEAPVSAPASTGTEASISASASVSTPACPVKIGFLLGSRRYTAKRGYFALGSTLQVHVLRLLQSENGLGSFECFIAEGEERIASATLTVFQPPDLTTFLEESAV
jgi:predicted hotdog family 3-hydroxylacyl-ACP dehydratase